MKNESCDQHVTVTDFCDTCKLRYVCEEQAEFVCKDRNYSDYIPETDRERSCISKLYTKKIRTHFARIVVGGTSDKPYYSIIYFDPQDTHFHQGYGSFKLEYVFDWLNENFEITGDSAFQSPIVNGVWERFHLGEYDFAFRLRCSNCGNVVHERNYKYCPNCGAKMDRKDDT